MRLACLSLALLMLTPSASAHVAPAVSENNRYLKISATGRRVRLAYTVYLGEVPGQMVRMKMDTNKDGSLSEAEYTPYGRELSREVAPNLSVSINGTPMKTAWEQVHVSLNDPQTSAGAFSVDMVAWYCLPGLADSYDLVVRDTFVPESPGESEIRLDANSEANVDKTTFGNDAALKSRWQWTGAESALAKDGLTITFHYDEPPAADPGCPDISTEAAEHRGIMLFFIGGGVLLFIILGVVIFGRRRK
jgi:hypothetical protein